MLYRKILKAAAKFPSVKRDSVIHDIKVEFRENQHLKDPIIIQEKIRVAERGLEELESYSKMGASSEWTKMLKGSCE